MLESKSYIPSQDKRFDVSSDSISRERILAVKVAFETLKNEVPFFAGVTVFGSLSKGKKIDETNENNDIDMVVFLDRDKYDQTIDKFAKETKNFILIPMIAEINVIEEELKSSDLENGSEVYLVNRMREIINSNLKNKIYFHEGLMGEDTRFISLDGDDSIFSRVEEHDYCYRHLWGYIPEESLFFDYAAPFFLDVGGGLRKYRKSFIKKLEQQPLDKAEHLWDIVHKSMIYWERKNEIPEKIVKSYPKTFIDAKKYYGDKEIMLE